MCIHNPTRKIEAPIRDRSESFGAVLAVMCARRPQPGDHTLVPGWPTSNVSSLKRPPRARKSHMLRSTTRPCHAPSPAAHAGRARSHGLALKLLDALWRELGGSASGHRGQGRRGGGSSGSGAAERAASEPSRGLSRGGRARGPHRSTRLERLTDLESHAPRGNARSTGWCGGAEPSAASPLDSFAH